MKNININNIKKGLTLLHFFRLLSLKSLLNRDMFPPNVPPVYKTRHVIAISLLSSGGKIMEHSIDKDLYFILVLYFFVLVYFSANTIYNLAF